MPVMNSLLSKAGLRRLLQSDEVWSLAKKRNQVELVPAEQDILQITESSNPPSSPSHRYCRQSQAPLRLISPERKAKSEGAGTACHHDPVKTLKTVPDVNEHDKKEARTPKSIESCRGERFQHPAEGPLKPVLNIPRFTLDPESHPCSDTPDDLQLHSEDSRIQPRDQENVKKTSVVHSSATPETKALNVKNNQRSKNVLLINNNHDVRDKKSSISYLKSDCECQRNIQASANATIVETPLFENLILKAVSDDSRQTEDGLACDEKSESFSIHSKELAWSEEEKDRLNDMCSLVFAEKYIVVPESSPFELNFNNKDGERRTTAEPFLSEILSPVDEVLSYGSAELPPSVRGLDSYSCPPHPAFEIITWTSEEELQVPADVLEDLSINSENLPPLPADVTLRRRESQSLCDVGDLCKTFTSSTCEDDENDCSEYTSSLLDDVKNEMSDPLSSCQIGDRVVVCNSRAGVLKYKGLAAFADGFWAGVALDTPNGNHNGTFRGVKYFSCEESHGVLVRAEDVSHIHREHGSDVETGVDEDPFSDEEPHSAQRNKQKDTSSSAGGKQQHRSRRCPPGDDSIPPKRQNEPQEDITDDAKDLSYSAETSSSRIVYDLIRHNGENRHLVDDSNHSVTELKHESGENQIQCTQDTKKRRRQRMKSLHDNIPIDTDVRKKEDSYFTPPLLEQWHQAQPDTPPKIKVPPHEDAIVDRLADAAVEILCGQADDDPLDCYETPDYLLDDKSRSAYRQVIFQLTSDVLHDILGDILRTKQSYQNIDNESAALQSSNISVSFLKEAVRKEIQKTLNLERDEQHMIEMLQKLCKYWCAKRDRVDYILIQELHHEERTWLDYTADQYTVKMRLTEEIFSLLLDDTILALNHLHFST
ncbi:centrosome-associated protein 350 isoform X2 [Triplophysa rosa]|uniref:centrosome-associated protein 350 isoform X2 n=1 Tax=Triplophysa rosa TaxID=992332 RepID=UPI002545EB21|nr:centrosome-associated protein 350 isoform X2 [Triplophysa rosa]